MAGSINKVILVGRLGKDPESKSFSNGNRVVNFSVATSETWKDKSTGERKEKTEWHNVAIFNEGLAGIAERFLRKGSRVYIEGALQTRKWQDQSGADRYNTEVVLKAYDGSIVLLDGKDDNGGGNRSGVSGGDNRSPQQSLQEQRSLGGGGGGFSDELDDDVPFASNHPAREQRRRVIL